MVVPLDGSCLIFVILFPYLVEVPLLAQLCLVNLIAELALLNVLEELGVFQSAGLDRLRGMSGFVYLLFTESLDCWRV